MHDKTLDVTTLYITEPGQLLAHTISLHLTPAPGHGEMRGTILFDRNLCSLDEWGDRTVCTKMASIPRDARAVALRTRDPHDLGRRLWDLHVDGVSDVKYHLVEYPHDALWALVIHAGDKGSAVAPLFPRKQVLSP